MAVGIVTEFNPLHNGHIIHINETRERLDNKKIIAVMSGNFVQRGEPAVVDKFKRTKMALMAGVDVVIELPAVFCLGGADYFARGAVGLLEATGIVTDISFGTECGDIGVIFTAASILADEPESFRMKLRQGLSLGLSFAAAQKNALQHCMENAPEDVFKRPNNTLAIEYIKALILAKSSTNVHATHRTQGISATAIRKSVLTEEYIPNTLPPYVKEILEESIIKNEIGRINNYSQLFKFMINKENIGEMSLLSEGLENRFRKYASKHSDLYDILSAVKTKRYTFTRLLRNAMSVILGLTNNDMQMYNKNNGPQYIRVLGFKKSSEHLLGEMKKKSNLPMITTKKDLDKILYTKSTASKMLQFELDASDVYKIAMGKNSPYRSEIGERIVII